MGCGGCARPEIDVEDAVKAECGEELLLFTTKTCPNCKMAKALLNLAGIKFTIIDAEEQKELTEKFGIKKAPTLLVPNGHGYDRYDNASEINRFIEAQKRRA